MTFVLVHGGGFGASCWDAVVPLLDGDVLAVDLPGRGKHPADLATVTVADFVDSVVADITDAGLDDVVLVGHSLAGITLPGVAARVGPRLRHIAFVSCSVPPQGLAVSDVLGSLSPSLEKLAADLGADLVDPEGGLAPEFVQAMFCNDMTPELAQLTLDLTVPEAVGVISEPIDLAGLDQPIPQTYVRLLQDVSLLPEAQTRMAANLREPTIIDVDAGHMVMISKPDALAEVLNRI
ncbi:MAG: esterase [Actinomycetia bacterium]|nr:esterase [Actinomycetes bacterium]